MSVPASSAIEYKPASTVSAPVPSPLAAFVFDPTTIAVPPWTIERFARALVGPSTNRFFSSIVPVGVVMQLAPWLTLKLLVSIELSPFSSTVISFAALTAWKSSVSTAPPPWTS